MSKIFTPNLNTNDMKLILQQMEKNICKIKLEYGFGTGFFCLIPINDYESLSVLITNHHVLNEKNFLQGKQIHISINNDKERYKILMENSRRIYTNKKYNISIIEIKKSDGLNGDSFLEIDDQIFNSKVDELYYKGRSIYLLCYGTDQNSKYSIGIIKI